MRGGRTGSAGARASKALRLVAPLALLLGTLVSPPAPVIASPYREAFVTMVSPRGDWVGNGTRYFHPGNADVTAGGHRTYAYAGVEGGTYGEYYDFRFAPAVGERLKVGDYPRARRFAELGHPMIDISGEHRGCNRTAGRFTIKDIAFDDRDRITRLWLVYLQRCDGQPPLTGEIRYGMPGDGGDLVVGPWAARWAPVPVNGITPIVPVRAVNTSASPVTVSSAWVQGDAAFRVRLDECSGRTLASNESCAVWLRFEPSSEGVHVAELHLAEGSGAVHVTTLEAQVSGSAPPGPSLGQPGAPVGGGPTLFAFDSDPGDYIGQGERRSYDPSNASFRVSGYHHGVIMDVTSSDEYWEAWFLPPAGDILAPGHRYAEAGRAAFVYGSAGLEVTGDGRGCNTIEGSFAVHALRVDEFGNLVEFHATFEQHCEGMEPALRGTVRWQHPGPLPTPPPYPPPPPEPDPQKLERDVTLTIRDRRASGRIEMEDSVTRCRVGVPVELQRKVDGRFRTVATVKTDDVARYVKWIGTRHGVYRAVAPRKVLRNGNVCVRDVSPRWWY